MPLTVWHAKRPPARRPDVRRFRFPIMLSSLFPLGWAHYLAGGLVIGAGVALLYVATGRLAGMSSVFSSSWSFVSARAAFQQPRWLESPPGGCSSRSAS